MDKKKQTSKLKKSFFSIKAKVTLLCTVFILVAVIISNALIAKVSENIIVSNTEETLSSLATAYSNNISETIRKLSESGNMLMSSQALTSYINSKGIESASETEELVSMFLSSNTSYEEVSLVDADGKIIYSSNSSMVGQDISTETYFEELVANGSTSQSDVYTSESSGDACVAFAMPLRDMSQNGTATMVTPDQTTTTQSDTTTDTESTFEFTGAVLTVVKVSAFEDALSNITIGDNKSSYAFLMDSTGTIVYHPTEELVGTKLDNDSITSLVNDIQDGKNPDSDILTYTYNGEEQYASFSVDSDSGWILMINADKSEILSSLGKISTLSTTIGLILIVILSALAYLFASTISKPIKKVTRLINATAELDFTSDHNFDKLTKRNDETGEMSRAIDKMRESLKDIILQISEASDNISESTQNLSNISNQVNDNASDNSATAEELSASMQETAATTDYMNSSIEQIGKNSQDINDKALTATQLSNELMKRAAELNKTSSKASDNTQKIYSEIKEKTDAAIRQSKAVEKINIMTKTIQDIASQTSLLALNASIEAARAGEAGRGFSVVASEIGSLAEQSSNTISNINEIVTEVNLAVNNMATSLGQTLQFLEKNVLTDYHNFNEISEQYNTDAATVNQTMDSIQNEINDLDSNVHNILKSISEINGMIREASAGVADVAENNTNIVSLTTNTYNMVNENTTHAENLKTIVDKFKL